VRRYKNTYQWNPRYTVKTDMCNKGLHKYTPENTYIGKDGCRRCRACKNDYFRKWMLAKKEKVNA